MRTTTATQASTMPMIIVLIGIVSESGGLVVGAGVVGASVGAGVVGAGVGRGLVVGAGVVGASVGAGVVGASVGALQSSDPHQHLFSLSHPLLYQSWLSLQYAEASGVLVNTHFRLLPLSGSPEPHLV